ncbi:methyl-accepting chemotaxis protein [Blastopirellula retiformator]|uniref:Biofilm dispersion protein BdlA n=1 Tax=Blastopirellula retiformator TaxID=2527970 RepID=A0A5C5V8W3_9BACT|nr:PAS domain-containing methyl-accepting chemotaxis protein [Blastopirellula retiformator]TWT34142.1 Biofilm dispersion protein BdlA [Blastopirellula retiformator]
MIETNTGWWHAFSPFHLAEKKTPAAIDIEEHQNALAIIAAIKRSNASIEFTMDATILTANDAFLQTMGYSLEEIQGQKHRMFVDPEEADSDEYQEFWASLNRGEFRSERFKRIGKGGKEVYIQATYNPILDSSGKPKKVVKFAIDVTRQTVAEFEASRLMNMVENLPINLMFADRQNIIRYINPASRKSMQKISHLLPVPVESVVGKSVDIFHQRPEKQRAILADADNLPVKTQFQLGSEVIDLEVNAIRDRDGSHIGSMATWQIITEHAAIRRQVGKLGDVGHTVALNVGDMASAMQEISSNVNRTASLAKTAEDQFKTADVSIQELGNCSEQIGEVVSLIRELAEQTNLLALNATIEAARAGEAGRSFAVVASEVKTLATGTRDATENIAERVGRISDSIAEVVKSTSEIAKGVSEVSQNSTTVAAAIEEQSTIIGGMKETSDDLVSLSAELQKL